MSEHTNKHHKNTTQPATIGSKITPVRSVEVCHRTESHQSTPINTTNFKSVTQELNTALLITGHRTHYNEKTHNFSLAYDQEVTQERTTTHHSIPAVTPEHTTNKCCNTNQLHQIISVLYFAILSSYTRSFHY